MCELAGSENRPRTQGVGGKVNHGPDAPVQVNWDPSLHGQLFDTLDSDLREPKPDSTAPAAPKWAHDRYLDRLSQYP
jgi:hypothetical protein